MPIPRNVLLGSGYTGQVEGLVREKLKLKIVR
jgi:hypothetical protein